MSYPRILTIAAVLLVLATSAALASVDVGYNETGLSIGNSWRWSGVRLNFRDRDVDRVDGLNFTIAGAGGEWAPIVHGVNLGLTLAMAEDATGVSLGLLGAGATNQINGVAAGLLGAGAGYQVNGVALGGLAAGSGRDINGVAIGGLAAGAGNRVNGVAIGGLAAGAGDHMKGVGLGLLVAGAGEGFSGLGAAFLAVGAGRQFSGIGLSGLVLGAGESIRGLGLAGLVLGAGKDVSGIHATLGVLGAGRSLNGLSLSGVMAGAGQEANGVTAATAYIKAPDVRGLAMTAGFMQSEYLEGAAVCGYCRFSDEQRGLAIGLFNQTDYLTGVQVGVLNWAGNNPAWARLLPVMNMHF